MTKKEEKKIFEPTEFERDETLNIFQRLHGVMRRVAYLQKEKKEGMNYSIVSHDKVTALLRSHFVDYGVHYAIMDPIEYTQNGNRTEVRCAVRFTNIDNPTDYLDVGSLGYGVDQQDKGPGKAISYAVKYALLKTLGLETGDDPDLHQGNEATHFTDLQQQLFELQNQVRQSPDVDALKELMASDLTVELMKQGQKAHPADWQVTRSVMSQTMTKLKKEAGVE